MVFEQIFGVRWLEKKPGLTFLLGFIYAELGIISALIIFPEDPSLISIGFISLLILPSLNSLLSLEANQDMREKRFSLKMLFKDHYDILEVYAFLFLGILFAYALFAILLPPGVTARLFHTQLDIYYSNVGNAVGQAYAGLAGCQSCEFWSILFNNIKVILVCFIFSLVYGAGSILFLTWNASVWGTIFGFVTKRTTEVSANLLYFGQVMLAVFPHMITEAMSYFLAVFAGGIISKAVIRERFDTKRFNHVVLDGIIMFGLGILLLVLAAYLEVYIFPLLNF
ncbi:MAG: stage II sporulation protein M [Nanoarchaeota archaeon]